MRKWLLGKSRKKIVDQHKRYRSTLKTYFNSLRTRKDNDYISMEDLEDPFITLGIAKSSKEVQKIVQAYDDNRNGKIEFDEFLEILDGRLLCKENKTFSNNRTSIQEFFRSRPNRDFDF